MSILKKETRQIVEKTFWIRDFKTNIWKYKNPNESYFIFTFFLIFFFLPFSFYRFLYNFSFWPFEYYWGYADLQKLRLYLLKSMIIVGYIIRHNFNEIYTDLFNGTGLTCEASSEKLQIFNCSRKNIRNTWPQRKTNELF